MLSSKSEGQMAKLVDALVSGTSVSNDVQVRVLFWAQIIHLPGGEIGRHASLRAGAGYGVQVRVCPGHKNKEAVTKGQPLYFVFARTYFIGRISL